MTALQEQAINLIKEASDDKVTYIISILRKNTSLNSEDRLTKSRTAFKELMSLCRKGTYRGDYKEDLAKALDEKYAGIN